MRLRILAALALISAAACGETVDPESPSTVTGAWSGAQMVDGAEYTWAFTLDGPNAALTGTFTFAGPGQNATGPVTGAFTPPTLTMDFDIEVRDPETGEVAIVLDGDYEGTVNADMTAVDGTVTITPPGIPADLDLTKG